MVGTFINSLPLMKNEFANHRYDDITKQVSQWNVFNLGLINF